MENGMENEKLITLTQLQATAEDIKNEIDNIGLFGNGSSIEVDSELSTVSENPVQNKVITEKFDEIFSSGFLKITAGTEDLVDGVSPLEDGTIYFVYEE